MRHGGARCAVAKFLRCEIPERPAKAAGQNSSTPIPIGETIPSPVMTAHFVRAALL